MYSSKTPAQAEVKKLLEEIKARGYDRQAIAKELGYHEKYIDVAVSRGPYKKLLFNLHMFLHKIKGSPPEEQDTYWQKELSLLREQFNLVKSELAKLDNMILSLEENFKENK